MVLEEIQHRLKKSMDKKRYEHTLGVMYTSAALCMKYELPVEQGMLAGVLHDCAKAYKIKEQYKLCEKYRISLNATELENGALIHAKLGSHLAKEIYKIEDEYIQNAIKYHTTGRPNMTLLEKILYIADYIEPNRNLPYLTEIQRMAFNDIDEALSFLLEISVAHLQKSGKKIDNMTIQTYAFYNKNNTEN